MLDTTLGRKCPAYTRDATGPQQFIDGLRALGERLGGTQRLYLRGPREAWVRSLQPLSPELLAVECLGDDGETFLVLGAVGVMQFEVRPAAGEPAGSVPEGQSVVHGA